MKLARSFRANNARRIVLIDIRTKERPLTADEARELARLQEWCAAWVNKRHPASPETMEAFLERGGIPHALDRADRTGG